MRVTGITCLTVLSSCPCATSDLARIGVVATFNAIECDDQRAKNEFIMTIFLLVDNVKPRLRIEKAA